jgi:hypothetical protein
MFLTTPPIFIFDKGMLCLKIAPGFTEIGRHHKRSEILIN